MKNKKRAAALLKSGSIVLIITVFSLSLAFFFSQRDVKADNIYFALAPGTPFTQNWTNAALITVSDDWSGVPSINGYRGDDLTVVSATDPQTILADGSATPLDVNANQTNPDVFNTGGVTEFAITDPVAALTGSGTGDAPFIDIRLDTIGCLRPGNQINVSYNLRDIDGSVDNSIQPVALQYRVGNAGAYTNIPTGFVADASGGPSTATLVTPVAVTLPAAAQAQPQLHLRIMTTNAVGNDEWIGIDDINITCPPVNAAAANVGGRVVTASGRGIGSVIVTLSGGNLTAPRFAITNPFGYYRFEEVQVGGTYVLSVFSKSYTFANPSRVISVTDNVSDADFVAEP